MRGRAGKSGGFTIIELLIVVVVIAILAAITIVAYSGIQGRTNATVITSNVRVYAVALTQYAAENNGLYPDAFVCLGVPEGTEHCGELRYEGAGCGEYDGVVVPFTANSNAERFNDAVTPYIGKQPNSIMPIASEYNMPSNAEDCRAFYKTTAPVYQALNKITVQTDGDIVLSTTSCGQDECPRDAFAISFRMTDGAACPELNGAFRSYPLTNTSLGEGCVVVGGDVVYE